MSDISAYTDRIRTYLEAVAAAHGETAVERAHSGVATLIPHEVFLLAPLLELDVATEARTDALLQSAQDWIAARRDCADFALSGLLRILYRYADHPRLTPERKAGLEETATNFCYWYDQRGEDGRSIAGMCFHTENHQILFHACEILAGQLFPDRVFPGTGQTGAWHAEQGAKRALRWMDHRARFGFSEWLSCYFEETLLGLLNLYDFAHDPTVRRRAGMLADMMLFEMALHAHRGVLGGTHGRTYAEFIKGGRRDPTTAIAWLVFGQGAFAGQATIALTALATSDYRCPPLIAAIAQDSPAPALLCRERHGLNVADTPGYGIDPDGLEDAMFFWACQTARHPQARAAARRVAQIADDSWLKNFIDTVDAPLPVSRALVEGGGGVFDGDAVNTALSEANIVSFRTLEYLLSCVQDFRPGRPGYQQHVWQATLDADAVVFTNAPGTDNESAEHSERPNFWAGNRWLPRAAQHENVVVCIHHVPAADRLPFSHAYFPRHAFDEVMQRGNWTFGRKGKGYVALYSQHPAHWTRDGGDIELRAENAPDNIWICEMGTEDGWDGFASFVDAVATASVQCDDLNVVYDSPTQGEIRFGWTGPLMVRDEETPLASYPRFDNRYCHAPLGEKFYSIVRNGERLEWDFR